MSRRRKHQGDAEISSDSFLDIIANIVGILIILIVVAGLRVSQAPVFHQPDPEVVIEEEPPRIEPDAETEVPQFVIGTTDAELWDPKTPKPKRPEPADPVVVDLTKETAPALLQRYRQQTAERSQLQAQFVSLQSQLSNAEKAIAQEETQLSSTSARLAEINEQLLSAKQTYDAERARLRLQSDSREEQKTKTAQLQSLLAEAEQKFAELSQEPEPNTEILRHDMTPVSQLAKEDELHFMVLNNRVAEVPIELLSKELERQIQSRRDWLLRANQHTGEVGPIRGFRMQYTVEKQQLSTLDQLRTGTNMVRIAVTRYVLIPDEDSLLTETYSQASGSTSRFLIAVRSAAPGTTCTFWVYPESFDTYQKLKQLAHQSNLRVAGRPLPKGMPITGSPTGSRSAAQ